ncbi:hypothetical protein ACFPOI_29265 [Nonomuraea angiospora]|uniref:DUF2497 domain-containing protein n=1 Tax=Nonomuraea angiospora TaxID=46172 RepID=A0ABR9LU28_9ACTN|nr:hypothetical protein [Nonomuraea angiospora]MBE1584159.1 hypothetical protein [Nonomuraea angiospora]
MPPIEDLSEEEAVRVLQHLMTAFDQDEEPATTQQEIEAKTGRDRAFVRELADALDVQVTAGAPAPSARELLAELAALPDVAPEVESAVERVRQRSTLPIGPDTIAAVIAIGAAVAIMRPRIELRRKRKDDELRFVADVRGVPNVGRIVQMLIDLLSK